MTARTRLVWLVLIVTSLVLASCGDDEASPETLLLRITSDAPAGGSDLDELRFLFLAEGPDGLVRFPGEADAGKFNRPVVEGFDPVVEPVHVAIEYGAQTFPAGTTVTLRVTGLAGGRAVTAFEGPVELDLREVVPVHLDAIGDACDEDGDGFLDCAIDGCCPAADSPFGDCEPGDADANPWNTEDPCEECGDGIDQDCRGGDAVCVDDDEDGVPDCKEVDCGAGDPTVAPGLDEVCDGKDNDCDGDTDEGFTWTWGRALLSPGDDCGVGVCAGGVVECSPDGTEAVCSTADLRDEDDACGDGLDNDCDGSTDEGCETDDLDGDGWTVDAGDCNDFDSGVYPGAPEPCCQEPIGSNDRLEKCDRNCNEDVDSFCDANDADGDGVAPPNDCDDTDPLVYPDAPEKCGDGIDQDCFAGDLSCDLVTDGDGDGWSPPADCDDDDAAVNPEAVEACDAVDNDCDGVTDEGNPDTNDSEACGSDVGECKKGTRVCVNIFGADAHGEKFEPGDVVCIGQAVGSDEVCDALDNDCDGNTDEDFLWEGLSVTYEAETTTPNHECDGTGTCGIGVVECLPDGSAATCSTNPDGSEAPLPELLVETCDGKDNDCDGTTDEDLVVAAIDTSGPNPVFEGTTCTARGVCGTLDGGAPLAVVRCKVDPEPDAWGWDCDYSAIDTYQAGDEKKTVDGTANLCDGLDNDCDGGADDEFNVGNGCDGDDADSCLNGIIVCDPADVSKAICDESNAANQPEVCDGEDNDCDGDTDEDFIAVGDGGEGLVSYDGGPFGGDSGAFKGQPCGTGACSGGKVICNAAAPSGLTCDSLGAQPDNEVGACDGTDNDCDGQTDEDFDIDVACGTGACQGGMRECLEDGSGTKCDTMPASQAQPEPGSINAAGAEVCDNVDNDCDASTDENLTNPANADCPGLGEGACADLATVDAKCTAGVWSCTFNSPDYQAGDELAQCDGLDNDCDGLTDEDYGPDGTVAYTEPDGQTEHVLADACGLGQCVGGTVVCSPSESSLLCDSMNQASDEVCDDADNDCDGDTDEDLTDIVDAGCDTDGACGEAGQTTALCTAGDWACFYDSPNYQEGDELGRCDTLDNDCDGLTDEDFSTGGAVVFTELDGTTTRTLGETCGLGECAGGTTTCSADGDSLVCPSLADAATDVCDTLDNDCNGTTDDDYRDGTVVFDGGPYAPDANKVLEDPCGTGACTGGKVVCDGPGALTCDSLGSVTAELCNGIDDDCDGLTDEDFKPGGIYTYDGGPFAPDADKALDQACGAGACENGKVVCDPLDPTKLTCDTLVDATSEICNDVDDDCDGKVDEDYKVGGTVTFDGGPYSADGDKVLGVGCGTGDCTGGIVECDAQDPTQLTCSRLFLASDEVCDDKDNDCNGTIDDPFYDGTVTYDGGPYAPDVDSVKEDTCGTGACGGGEVVCDTSDATAMSLTCSTLVNGEAESCNGLDDDCDGSTDEDYKDGTITYDGGPYSGDANTVLDDPCGAGVCAGGTVVCSDGGDLTCSKADQATALNDSTCNDLDDDCNGVEDDLFLEGGLVTYEDWDGAEKYKGQACGTGACEGFVVCDTNTTLTCSGAAPAGDDSVCNGIDDDCDGQTDEDYVGSATTCGNGPCKDNGMEVCSNGEVVDTCQAGTPSTQTDATCDGVDDDCNGQTDEDYVATATACGTGACASAGSTSCVEGEVVDSCSPSAPAASDATCDNVDDDCNGQTDENFVGQEITCGVGACEVTVTSQCTGGTEDTTCAPGPTTGDDSDCDGVDDNCDGFTDENYVSVRCDGDDGDTCRTGTSSCTDGIVSCGGDVQCPDWEPGCSADASETVPDQCVCEVGGGSDTCTANSGSATECDPETGQCVEP